MIVVTGAAGFIGSAMIWYLNRSGIRDILAVDHLSSSPQKWHHLLPLTIDGYMEKNEFRNKLRNGFFTGKKLDGIIHLGACSSTLENDEAYLMDNNFRYTAELAEYCTARKIRFVYASSCATYGDGRNGFADDETLLEKLRPLNLYAHSKHSFDLWAHKNGMLKTIAGCKFSNIFGPNESHKGEMRSMVLRSWENIRTSGKSTLFRSYRPEYADGEQLRDFLYVKDAVKMTGFLFNSGAGGIYNIGSGKPESWNKLIAAVFSAMGRTENIEYVDMPETLRAKYQYYTCADPGKLLSLGYREKLTPLPEAVADYIQNYLEPGRELGDE